MPRLIFGLPLNAVVLSAVAFVLMIVVLLPSAELNVFRPILIAIGYLIIRRVYIIMRTKTEFAIIRAIDRNNRIVRAARVID